MGTDVRRFSRPPKTWSRGGFDQLRARPALVIPWPVHAYDLKAPVQIEPGSDDHARLIDLASACRGPDDARSLALRLGGMTHEDIGLEIDASHWSVGRRLARIFGRARGPRG